MIGFLRQVLLLAVSAVASWWLFLCAPAPLELLRDEPATPAAVVALTPATDVPEPVVARELEPPEQEPIARELEPREPEPAPPPPELGTPEGEDEGAPPASEPLELDGQPAELEQLARDAGVEEEPEPAPQRATSEELMRDPALVAAAEQEFAERERRGFATVLLCAPEEQLELAGFFGEELVLVPREAIRPGVEAPRYYRLAGDRVETVDAAPPLERYRQYRDLFDYEYARLPAPLRRLRRTVLARDDVFLFAALLPAREWALVIGRRAEALERAGRPLEEVRRFVLRYVRRPEGGFDLRVEEILFEDGTRHEPDPPTR